MGIPMMITNLSMTTISPPFEENFEPTAVTCASKTSKRRKRKGKLKESIMYVLDYYVSEACKLSTISLIHSSLHTDAHTHIKWDHFSLFLYYYYEPHHLSYYVGGEQYIYFFVVFLFNGV